MCVCTYMHTLMHMYPHLSKILLTMAILPYKEKYLPKGFSNMSSHEVKNKIRHRTDELRHIRQCWKATVKIQSLDVL